MPKIIEVIVLEKHIGNGTNEKPHSTITTYYDKDGQILAENFIDLVSNPWYIKERYIVEKPHK